MVGDPNISELHGLQQSTVSWQLEYGLWVELDKQIEGSVIATLFFIAVKNSSKSDFEIWCFM